MLFLCLYIHLLKIKKIKIIDLEVFFNYYVISEFCIMLLKIKRFCMQLKYMLLLSCYVQFSIASQLIPSQFFGFKIKPTIKKNTIITNFKNDDKVLLPLVAAHFLGDFNNQTVCGLISMYQDFKCSENQLLEYVNIIKHFTDRSNTNPGLLISFVVNRYQQCYAYGLHSINGYLKAFNDVKIIFFYGQNVLRKLAQGQPIESSERTFIMRYSDLLAWAVKNNYIQIPTHTNVVAPTMDRLQLAVQPLLGTAFFYFPVWCGGMQFVDSFFFKGNVTEGSAAAFGLVSLFLDIGFVLCLYKSITPPVFNKPLINRYFLDDNQVVSIEEMNDIIENSVE